MILKANFSELFHRHAAASFEKQLRLGDVLGDRAWNFAMEEGTVTFAKRGFFGRTLPLEVQVLGTESEASDTWLWSWANAASRLPAALTEKARELRTLGERSGYDELVDSQSSLDDFDGHKAGLLASGIFSAAGYYRCPYPGGAMFVLFPDAAILPAVEHPVMRVLSVFPQAVDTLELTEHRTALLGLLKGLGFTVTKDSRERVDAQVASGTVHATFDGEGRLRNLEGSEAPVSAVGR